MASARVPQVATEGLGGHPHRDLQSAAEAHADLLRAIRSRDVDEATSLLSSHLLGAGNRLRTRMQQVRQA
ncbi:FCD domain-containing protein [Streptomyces sp. NPDC048248]|uniref:FCD domain-containing protein n=1 Tax=Streptomyces sp. NPDC048248 TaxID=3365523 RepID=UPI00371BF274